VPASILSFDVGEFRCHAIDDGVSTYATGAFLFASASEAQYGHAILELGQDPKAIPCSNTCLLVEAGAVTILIDTGLGAVAEAGNGVDNLGQLRSGLDELGVKPSDIDIVILTHLHGDHSFGCLAEDGKRPVFTAARHVVHRAEWDHIHPSLADRADALMQLFDSVEGNEAVLPGVGLVAAPGHSCGHCAVHIESGGEVLLCVGDAIAHPLNLRHPEWTMAHETNPSLAIASRRKLIDLAISEHSLVHAFHMPFPSVGKIVPTEEAYQWKPLSCAS